MLEDDFLPISAVCVWGIVEGCAEGGTVLHGAEDRCFDNRQLR
jgi:hypothetical protein